MPPLLSCLNIDKNGAVWIGTGQGHIAKFDGAGWEVFKSGPATGLPAGSMAKSIRFDGNGVMYFANYIGGAYKYAGHSICPMTPAFGLISMHTETNGSRQAESSMPMDRLLYLRRMA